MPMFQAGSTGGATTGANTLTGQQALSANGVASTPPLVVSGAIFTGGTSTTTKPHVLIEPAGTVSTTWNTAGTGLGINAPSGFTGRLADFQVNGSSQLSIASNGSLSTVGNISSTGYILSSSTVQANGSFVGSSSTSGLYLGGSNDTILSRRAAANFQLGAADIAAPVAQTLTAQSVVAGTTNTAAPNFTVQGPAGTGTGAGGSVKLQTAPAGITGTAQNAFVDSVVVSPAVLSSSALLMPQPWVVTGGTATTTKPAHLIEPAGTVSTSWNTLGTGFGVNAPSGFTGNLFDFQVNGVSKAKLDVNSQLVLTVGLLSNTNIRSNQNIIGDNGVWVDSNSGNYFIGNTTDTILSRRAAANWQFGNYDAAAPVAQTLTAQSVVAGTTNTAAPNFTVQGSAGTGTGSGGSVKLQTAPAGTTGSSQNAFVDSVVVSPAVVSSAALLMPQPWVVSGGTSTTTKPALLIEPAGTVSTAWYVNGTGLGVNAPSGYNGNLADFQRNGVSQLTIDSSGAIHTNSDIISTGASVRAGTFIWASTYIAGTSNSSAFYLGSSNDTILTRRAAANWQHGAADAAAPVAQTLTAQSVVAGTTNTAAPNFIVQGAAGTGTGAGGSVKLQTAPAGATGSSQNAFVDTVVASPAVASSAALLMPQPWFTGGTNTTTKPAMLIEPAGTPSTNWSVSGTGLGINAPAGFTGYPLVIQKNNSSIFYVDSTGGLTVGSGVSAISGYYLGNSNDTILIRRAAANWQLGAADVAAPIAQTLTAQSVVAGTTNTAGPNFTVQAPVSTGSAVSGDLVFQTGGTGAAATAQNAFTTAMTVKGATQQVIFASTIKTLSTTVSGLPSAATAGSGSRAFVTDATAVTFLSIVAGAGANKVPVVSDGTNWLIG